MDSDRFKAFATESIPELKVKLQPLWRGIQYLRGGLCANASVRILNVAQKWHVVMVIPDHAAVHLAPNLSHMPHLTNRMAWSEHQAVSR